MFCFCPLPFSSAAGARSSHLCRPIVGVPNDEGLWLHVSPPFRFYAAALAFQHSSDPTGLYNFGRGHAHLKPTKTPTNCLHANRLLPRHRLSFFHDRIGDGEHNAREIYTFPIVQPIEVSASELQPLPHTGNQAGVVQDSGFELSEAALEIGHGDFTPLTPSPIRSTLQIRHPRIGLRCSRLDLIANLIPVYRVALCSAIELGPAYLAAPRVNVRVSVSCVGAR
jgi:hypothetical protein